MARSLALIAFLSFTSVGIAQAQDYDAPAGDYPSSFVGDHIASTQNINPNKGVNTVNTTNLGASQLNEAMALQQMQAHNLKTNFGTPGRRATPAGLSQLETQVNGDKSITLSQPHTDPYGTVVGGKTVANGQLYVTLPPAQKTDPYAYNPMTNSKLRNASDGSAPMGVAPGMSQKPPPVFYQNPDHKEVGVDSTTSGN